jgi:salicylate hydroxylase
VIGILGGGIGGLAAALALHRAGREVAVFEQARQFARVGADVNLTPNAVRALDRLGLGAALRGTAARPTHRISRMWDTGEETSRLPMSDAAEAKYGAPQLTIHRADLLRALEDALPAGTIRLAHRAERIAGDADGVTIGFAGGEQARVAALIGADGIHSVLRAALFGADAPRFTGIVSYRAVVPAERLEGQPDLGAFTKWWGPSREVQIVTFPLSLGREIFVFATTPQDDWRHESWTMPGDVDELREVYRDFHPEARRLLAACDTVLKTALYDRDPLPAWSLGRATLLGDAAHPMLPFMAQGACQAIEDAVVLTRALALRDDAATAFGLYESARRERTARIQAGSRANDWLRQGGNADWVYGYDAWTATL